MLLFGFNPVLIAAAIIPALALLLYVYRSDRLEKESPQLIKSLVLAGVTATLLATVTERLGSDLLSGLYRSNPTLWRALTYFLIVGLSEEGFKYLVLYRRTWRSPEFNCQYDGVVYAVSVSLGFALWENIGYVMMYGFGTALVRAVTAVPGHACFGVFMGVWYGAARRMENLDDRPWSLGCRIVSVLLPTLLHGTYDYIASTDTGSEWTFIVFVLCLFAAAWLTVRRMSAKDRCI